MTTQFTREQLTQTRQLLTVRRAGVALELGTATFNIFTITNGPVFVFGLVGHSTELIAGTALPQLEYLPVGGGAQSDLCAAAADIDTDAINTVYGWTGLIAGLLTPGVGIGHLDLTAAQANFLCPLTVHTGTIIVTDATAAAVTGGLIDWYITYIPFLATGLIVAA